MKIINFIKSFIGTNRSLCLKILAALVVVIAILVVVSVFKGSKNGNSAGNINNYGFAVQDGNWIYFEKAEDGELVGIYKVKQSGKNATKVIDGVFYYLNIEGNYIYCLEQDEDKEQDNLVKMRKNGKNKEILVKDVDDETVYVVDKWVYYMKNDKLCRIKTNGQDKETVSEKEIEYYQIEGKYIYYIYENNDTDYIAKMKLNGDDSEKILKADSSEYIETLNVQGSTIYYVKSELNKKYDSEYSLCKMNLKGEKIEKVCDLEDNIRYVNMQDDRIYYSVTEDYDEYEIKSIKYNGKDCKTIKKFDNYVGQINVVGDWIVYVTENDDHDNTIQMVNKKGDKEKSF